MLALQPTMSPSPQTDGAKTPPTKTSPPPPTPAAYPVGGGRGEQTGKGVTDKRVHLVEAHSRVFDAFSRAFSRQNVQFEKGKCRVFLIAVDSLRKVSVERFLLQ